MSAAEQPALDWRAAVLRDVLERGESRVLVMHAPRRAGKAQWLRECEALAAELGLDMRVVHRPEPRRMGQVSFMELDGHRVV